MVDLKLVRVGKSVTAVVELRFRLANANVGQFNKRFYMGDNQEIWI